MSDDNQLSPEDKAALLDHNYDGIQEMDHPLPKWWIVTFILTIIFGVPYFFYYTYGGGPTLQEEHTKNMAVINQAKEEELKKSLNFDESYYEAIVKDDGVAKGKVVFETNCVSCHKEQAIGDIGPNLTDSYWIHGNGHPHDLYVVVSNGVEEKGMPIWKEMISKEEIYQTISYVHNLRNKHLKGKEPQGEKVDD